LIHTKILKIEEDSKGLKGCIRIINNVLLYHPDIDCIQDEAAFLLSSSLQNVVVGVVSVIQ